MFSSNKLPTLNNANQIYLLKKTLENVTSNILRIAKITPNNEMETKLKLSELEKERSEVIMLVVKSQSVLSAIEILIADVELTDKLRIQSKRKCEEDGSNSKKSKVYKGDSKVSTNELPSSTAKLPRQSNKKTTLKLKGKKTKGVVTPNSELTVPTTTSLDSEKNMKTLNNNKENCNNNPLPSIGRQIVILSRPPMRKDAKSDRIGYITNDHTLRHNKIENSIYSQTENIERFAKTMSSTTNEVIKQKYATFYNENHRYCNQRVEICEQIQSESCNKKQMTVSMQKRANSVQNDGDYVNQNMQTHCSHNNTICNNKTWYDCENKLKINNESSVESLPNDLKLNKIEKIDILELGETKQPGKHFRKVNEIFKSIMKGKAMTFNDIKKEKESQSHTHTDGNLLIENP